MKSTDLMLGDIVVVNYEGVKKTVRVLRLHKHYTDLINDNGTEFDSVPYTLIEGMPITEEFLKLNGIRTDGETYYFETQYLCEFGVIWGYSSLNTKPDDCLCWATCGGEEHVVMLEYVHELQHAIRLARIEGVADNLKVVANGVQ